VYFATEAGPGGLAGSAGAALADAAGAAEGAGAAVAEGAAEVGGGAAGGGASPPQAGSTNARANERAEAERSMGVTPRGPVYHKRPSKSQLGLFASRYGIAALQVLSGGRRCAHLVRPA